MGLGKWDGSGLEPQDTPVLIFSCTTATQSTSTQECALQLFLCVSYNFSSFFVISGFYLHLRLTVYATDKVP